MTQAGKSKPRKVEQYRALRIVSTIYNLAGLLVLFLSVLYGGFLLITPPTTFTVNGTVYSYNTGGVVTGLIVIFGGVMGSLGFFAIGQLIRLILEMLENSRRQTQMLEIMTRVSLKREV